MSLISKIEALKVSGYKASSGYQHWNDVFANDWNSYNQAIDDVIALPEIQAVDELVAKIQILWDITYPEVEIRQLLKKVQNETD